MKIALITPFLPYQNVPHAGGQFTYQILKYLSQDHKVTLIARLETNESIQLHELSEICHQIYPLETSCGSKYPWVFRLKTIFSYFRFFRWIRRVLHQNTFDLIQFEYSESAFFFRLHSNPKLVLNMHDVVTRRIRLDGDASCNIVGRTKHFLAGFGYELMERTAVRKMDHILVRSVPEKTFVNDHFHGEKVSIIPLIIDEDCDIVRTEPELPTLLFTGAFNRKYNEQAAIFLIDRIFRALQSEITEIKLILGGNKPGRILYEKSAGSKNIKITGFIPSLTDLYLTSTVFVSPVFTGGGMIYKNIEAMNCGLPVITTPKASEGIGGENGKHLIIAEDEHAFCSAIKRVIADQSLRSNLGRNGQNLVRDQFNSGLVLKRYANIIASVITPQKGIAND